MNPKQVAAVGGVIIFSIVLLCAISLFIVAPRQTYPRGIAYIVYDEDTRTGSTVKDAVLYFKRHLSSDDVLGAVNVDNRLPLAVDEQGRFWETLHAPGIRVEPEDHVHMLQKLKIVVSSVFRP